MLTFHLEIMKVQAKIKRISSLNIVFLVVLIGKDAYDVAIERESDECKEIIAKALEKKGIKASSRGNQSTTTTEKLTDDVEKLKIKH